jgi:glutamate 5-kinase
MKTRIFLSAITALVFTFISCSSDDDGGSNNENPTEGFVWKQNGTETTYTAATATFSEQYKTLMAKDASNNTLFEINLNGTSAATYAIGANNAFTYVAANPFYIATAGNVVISANSGGKISGTFQTTGSGSGITSIDGTFTNIDVVL